MRSEAKIQLVLVSAFLPSVLVEKLEAFAREHGATRTQVLTAAVDHFLDGPNGGCVEHLNFVLKAYYNKERA